MTVVMDRDVSLTSDGCVVAGEAVWSMADEASGTTVVLATPRAAPRVWRDYIDGAMESYMARGVADAVEYDAVRCGAGTHVFCAVLDGRGRVVAGLRVQGRYRDVYESHAVGEWAGQPGRDELVAAMWQRLAGGLIEVKTAFVVTDCPAAGAVAAILARSALLLMTWTGARYVMATAADYVLDRWRSGGGRVDAAVAPAPYPNDRYRTQVMFWDRARLARDADPVVWAQMCADHQRFIDDQTGVAGQSQAA